jgi:hypothetical protein
MRFVSWCRLLLILGAILLPAVTDAQQRTLNIRPVAQSTPVWCWAAVGEMVFRHYDVPTISPAGDYQCGIVGGLGGPCWDDCRRCIIPAGQMTNIAAMIVHYPRLAEQLTGRRTRDLDAVPLAATLSPDEIVAEIDQGRPLVAGISPSGMRYPGGLAEHVALVVGYRRGAGDLRLVVNDPYPFAPGNDPYQRAGAKWLQPGQYLIGHSTLVRHLGWNSTILIGD